VTLKQPVKLAQRPSLVKTSCPMESKEGWYWCESSIVGGSGSEVGRKESLLSFVFL